jgi:fermentation-respiration switch protein FrsA (DUF1100 family)
MFAREFLEVDPATLHVPNSRRSGADPYKLLRQIARHGTSLAGMPPVEVLRGTDGKLVIYDGVTRATRAARNAPGAMIPVEVTGAIPIPGGSTPTIGELI